MESVIHHICIPSGKPPALLPKGPPVEGLLSPTGSGLVDRGEGLARAFGAKATVASTTPEGRYTIPSDEEILAWCKECLKVRRDAGELLQPEALRYWVRYTFQPYTNEYKAVGARISVLLGEK